MEAAHVLVIGDSAWIYTGKRGEHNKWTPARITRIKPHVGLLHTPDLQPGDVVSIEDGSRRGQRSRCVIDLGVGRNPIIQIDRDRGILIGLPC